MKQSLSIVKYVNAKHFSRLGRGIAHFQAYTETSD